MLESSKTTPLKMSNGIALVPSWNIKFRIHFLCHVVNGNVTGNHNMMLTSTILIFSHFTISSRIYEKWLHKQQRLFHKDELLNRFFLLYGMGQTCWVKKINRMQKHTNTTCVMFVFRLIYKNTLINLLYSVDGIIM